MREKNLNVSRLRLIVDGGGSLATHLGIVGINGPKGIVTLGRDNGLFATMVDGAANQTNWFFTAGMSALQVGKAITFVSADMQGMRLGVQAFDIGKGGSTGNTTNNYTVAGAYANERLTIGAGFTQYSEYADDSGNKYTSSTDTNQFEVGTNTFAGAALENAAGVSVAYKDKIFGVVAALISRKPGREASNAAAINTLIVTGTVPTSTTVSLVGNVSLTKQRDSNDVDGKQGTIVTLMASYAPAVNVKYTFELQHANADANRSNIDGATGVGGTKSNIGVALGATYEF